MTLARIEDRGDRVLVINANAEKRGALSPDLYEAILKAAEMAKEPRIGSIVLTSEGGFFCAGGDLTVLIDRRTLSEPERRDKIEDLHDMMRALRSAPVPVIAAVEGGAAGAGLSIALAADMIVAAKGARFVAAYVKAGLVPDGGLTSSMARMLPRPLAMEMCLLGRPVLAERLNALGVVNQLTEVGEAEAAAMQLADALAAGPRDAQGAIRKLVADAYEATEAQQLDSERNAMARASGSEEAGAGIRAFLEKRPPEFPR